MALFDQLAQLPPFRRLWSALQGAMDSGSEERVRSVLDQVDLLDLGNAHTAWTRTSTQPYEEDPELAGARLPWTVRQLMRTDPKVHMCQRALVATALTAEWEWAPGNDTPLGIELAREANDDFGWGATPSPRMARSFDEVIEEAVSVGPAVGVCAHEVQYRLMRVGDGMRWVVYDYLYRPPESYHSFDVVDDELRGLRQQGVGGGAECYIPAHKLLLMGYGAAADNYWGSGWVRAAYPWALLKRFIKDLIAAGAERDSLASIIVKIDKREAEQHGYSGPQLERAIKKAMKIAGEYAGGSRSWLSTIAGIVFDRLPSTFNPAGLLAVIVQCNQEILAACVGAPLLELGVVAPGNRAIGELFTEKLIENVANLLDQYGRRLGGPLGAGRGTATRVHDINRNRLIDPAAYPVARHHGLRPDRLAQLYPHLPALRAAGFATPTDRVEQRIWRSVGEVMDTAALRSPAERLAGNMADVVSIGPAVTPDGAPVSPAAVAAGIERVQEAA